MSEVKKFELVDGHRKVIAEARTEFRSKSISIHVQTCFRISIDAETWHHHNATTLLTPEMLIQMGEWAKTLVSKKE